MVETSFMVAAIGVGGTLIASIIGSIATYKTTKMQQTHQNHRTVADHYMNEKVDQLLSLYYLVSHISTYFVEFIIESRDNPDASIRERRYQYHTTEVTEFFELYKKCRIFLTEEQNEILGACVSALMLADGSFYEEEGEYKIDWEQVEADPAVKRYNIDLDTFRMHTRLVEEMLHEELNAPVDELYDDQAMPPIDEQAEWLEYVHEIQVGPLTESGEVPSA